VRPSPIATSLVLVGPQHAPSPALGSPRMRMEVRRAGSLSDSAAIDDDRSSGMGGTRLSLDRCYTRCPSAGPGPPDVWT